MKTYIIYNHLKPLKHSQQDSTSSRILTKFRRLEMSKESQREAPSSEEKLLGLTPEEVKKTTSGVGSDVKMTKFNTEHQKKFKMAAKRSAATKPQQKKRTIAKQAVKKSVRKNLVENSFGNSLENLCVESFENSSESLYESMYENLNSTSNSYEYEDEEQKYDDMRLSYMMVRGNWEEWWLDECKKSLDKCFNMISEMSSNKKATKATPGSTKGQGNELECNFADCSKKYKTITGLVKHQKSCHDIEVSDEVIAKYKTEAKNLNLELDDSNLELNLSETLLKQVPLATSSQKESEVTEEKKDEGMKDEVKNLKRGRGESMLDDEGDEENKRLKEELDNLPIDSALLDDTCYPFEERVTDTQAERDKLFSELMSTQATATPEAVAPPLVENPSSVSDGLSILSTHPPIERSASDIFANGSESLDPNKETIKELEDDLRRRTESLTNALSEIEKLKSELAIKQVKCDSLQHQLDNKCADLNKWIEGAKKLKSQLNSANPSAQPLTPTQLAPGLAEELERVRNERDNLKRLYDAAIKEKTDAVREKDDAVLISNTNQELTRRIEMDLKKVKGQLSYYMKRTNCTDPDCVSDKNCGKSHEEKDRMRGGNEDNREQCAFFNKGTCKFDDKKCRRKHCPNLKAQFLANNLPACNGNNGNNGNQSETGDQGQSIMEVDVTSDLSQHQQQPDPVLHPFQQHEVNTNGTPFIPEPQHQRGTPQQIPPQHQVNVSCSNRYDLLSQENTSVNEGGNGGNAGGGQNHNGCNNGKNPNPNHNVSCNGGKVGNGGKLQNAKGQKKKFKPNRSTHCTHNQTQDHNSSNRSQLTCGQQGQGQGQGQGQQHHHLRHNNGNPGMNGQARPTGNGPAVQTYRPPAQSAPSAPNAPGYGQNQTLQAPQAPQAPQTSRPQMAPHSSQVSQTPSIPDMTVPPPPPGFQQQQQQVFRFTGPAASMGTGTVGPQSNWTAPPQANQATHPTYPQQMIPNLNPVDLALQAQQAQTLRNYQRQQYLRLELEKVQNSLNIAPTPTPGVGEYSEVINQQENLRWLMNR